MLTEYFVPNPRDEKVVVLALILAGMRVWYQTALTRLAAVYQGLNRMYRRVE